MALLRSELGILLFGFDEFMRWPYVDRRTRWFVVKTCIPQISVPLRDAMLNKHNFKRETAYSRLTRPSHVNSNWIICRWPPYRNPLFHSFRATSSPLYKLASCIYWQRYSGLRCGRWPDSFGETRKQAKSHAANFTVHKASSVGPYSPYGCEMGGTDVEKVSFLWITFVRWTEGICRNSDGRWNFGEAEIGRVLVIIVCAMKGDISTFSIYHELYLLPHRNTKFYFKVAFIFGT